MSASAINYVVSFLTRPLMKTYSPTTILALQISLHNSLSSASGPSSSASSFSLLLSAKCLPPLALQRACAVTGVRWSDWIKLLSRGLDVHMFITDLSVAVALGKMPRRPVWIAPRTSQTSIKPASSLAHCFPPALLAARPRASARLRAAICSARERDCRGSVLNPTRVPTLLSSSYTADDLPSDVDSDLDSDYDSESDISDSGCSSVSSLSSHSSRKSTATSLSRDSAALSDVTRFVYDGGATQVVSGRVMLGPAVFPSVRRPSGKAPKVYTARKVGGSSADGCWRSRATA